MAPAGNRFDKTSPKEHFGGGCCSHREWAKVRNPGMRLSTNAVVGLELKATGSRILGLNPAFPMNSDPGVRFCNANGIVNFPASSHAGKKQENSVQGGTTCPRTSCPRALPLPDAALCPKAPNVSLFQISWVWTSPGRAMLSLRLLKNSSAVKFRLERAAESPIG